MPSSETESKKCLYKSKFKATWYGEKPIRDKKNHNYLIPK